MNINLGILLIIFFVFLLILSYFIENDYLRIMYWLTVALLALSVFNIILVVNYYIKLRNEEGVRGPRGSRGEKGPDGNRGVCSVTDQCSINNCEDKIVEITSEIFPDVSVECIKNSQNCNEEEKVLGVGLSQHVKLLSQKCSRSKIAEKDFFRKIRPSIVRLKSDPVIND